MVGERVLCRDYRSRNKKGFVQCIVDEVLGDYLCKILADGTIWKRHLNQMIKDKSATESGILESLSNETENRLRRDPIVNDFNRLPVNLPVNFNRNRNFTETEPGDQVCVCGR